MNCYYCNKEGKSTDHDHDCVHEMERPFIIRYLAMKRCGKFYYDVWYRYSDSTLKEAERIAKKYGHC